MRQAGERRAGARQAGGTYSTANPSPPLPLTLDLLTTAPDFVFFEDLFCVSNFFLREDGLACDCFCHRKERT